MPRCHLQELSPLWKESYKTNCTSTMKTMRAHFKRMLACEELVEKVNGVLFCLEQDEQDMVSRD